MSEPAKCELPVLYGYHRSPCGRNARFHEEGKDYCGIHAPSTVAKRRAKRDERWRAEAALIRRASDRRVAREAAREAVLKAAREWRKVCATNVRTEEPARIALCRAVDALVALESEGMSERQYQYAVTWKREGLRAKRKRFDLRVNAERFLLLFGPEPWRCYAPNAKPDDLVCCSGRECGCDGLTYSEENAAKREEMPKLLYVRLEVREVGPWMLARTTCPSCGE